MPGKPSHTAERTLSAPGLVSKSSHPPRYLGAGWGRMCAWTWLSQRHHLGLPEFSIFGSAVDRAFWKGATKQMGQVWAPVHTHPVLLERSPALFPLLCDTHVGTHFTGHCSSAAPQCLKNTGTAMSLVSVFPCKYMQNCQFRTCKNCTILD